MTIIDCEQGTPEWFQSRLGRATASNFDKIVKMDGKRSKQRDKYLYRIAGEMITGYPEDSYKSAIMQRGNDLEGEARSFYEYTTGQTVQTVGFCDERYYGCSPDGLVGDDGMVQIKCPIMSTHVHYLIKNALPPDYFQQVQGELFVTKRKWLDFVSYYPGMKPLIVRVTPDREFQKKLKSELEDFYKDLKKVINQIST